MINPAMLTIQTTNCPHVQDQAEHRSLRSIQSIIRKPYTSIAEIEILHELQFLDTLECKSLDAMTASYEAWRAQ